MNSNSALVKKLQHDIAEVEMDIVHLLNEGYCFPQLPSKVANIKDVIDRIGVDDENIIK